MTFQQVMDITCTVSAPDALQDVECKALYDTLLRIPPCGIVVEIGCQLGRSSSIIAQVQQVVKYHTIHIDPYTEQPEYLRSWITTMWKIGGSDREFVFLCMRTAQAEWLLSKIGEVDLVFVDGDHEYPSVMTDLHLVGDRVKRGGYLTAHDFSNEGLPGVKQAISEYIDLSWHEIGIFGSLGVWLKK
jgi:predicted O-methyltransferase YrrM